MVSFVNDDNGNVPKYYIAMTLSANDGNGFQQKIDFDPSSFSSSYFASDLSNINIQDGAGNVLYSWQETHAPTTSSTDVIYWAKLPNATITTIYIVLVDTTKSCYSTTHTGVEPTYDATYAHYDNGANVFAVYDNFSGTSISSIWNTAGVASLTVNNSASFTSSSANNSAIATNTSYSTPLCWDALMKASGSNPTIGLVFATPNASAAISSGYAAGYDTNFVGSADGIGLWNSSSSRTILTTNSTAVTPTSYVVVNMQISSSGGIQIEVAYGTDTATYPTMTVTNTTYTSAPIGAVAWYNDKTSYLQWFRSRTYPSGGTQPTVSFGSVTPVTPSYTSALLYF